MTDDDPFADLGETLENNPEKIERPDPVTDTAFSYEEAEQRPFYAREETIEEFDSWLKYELERELDQQGYQNIVVREMTDALLRTVVEEDLIEEVAERFERARTSASSISGE